MPFNSAEITQAGFVSLDSYMRNNPIDQVAIERPFMRAIMNRGGSEFGGGKQFCVEQIRIKYDSNFQFYHGPATVTYNKKDTIRQASFTWGSTHDGFYLSEDDLLQNGIILNDQNKKGYTADEVVQLTDLLKENTESLRLGYEEQFSINMHQDGTQDVDAIPGLDHLIQVDPTASSIVGGIDQSVAANSYWRNNVALDTSQANLLGVMETEWRNCIRNGGRPDFILAGTTAVDTFRAAAAAVIERHTIVSVTGQGVQYDPSVTQSDMGVSTGLHFQNVPIMWSPEFEELDTLLSPTQEWESRIYFINRRHVRWRPVRGHKMVTRRPPREFNRYVWYFAITNKGVFTTNRRNAHALITVTGS